MTIRAILSPAGLAITVAMTLLFTTIPAPGADSHLADRSKAIVADTKDTVVDASQSVADGTKNLWHKIDEEGLTNRTRDEIVAWMIMGGLVGGLAGMLTTIRSTGFGRLGRLLLGLTGAFLGGLAVRLGHLDLGWGPVMIRYDELFFSFVGALALIVFSRLIRAKTQKKRA